MDIFDEPRIINVTYDVMTTQVLGQLDPESVISYCTSAKETLEMCKNDQFLIPFVKQNYGVDIRTMKEPETSWDKFLFVSSIERKLKEWDASDITVEHVSYIYDTEVEGDDIDPEYGHEVLLALAPIYKSETINTLFKQIIATRSPGLLSYAIEKYREMFSQEDSKVKNRINEMDVWSLGFDLYSYDEHPADVILVPTYIEVLQTGDEALINAVLASSYEVYFSVAIENEFRKAIVRGELGLVEELLRPRAVLVIHDEGKTTAWANVNPKIGMAIPNDIVLAETFGHTDIAELLRNWNEEKEEARLDAMIAELHEQARRN